MPPQVPRRCSKTNTESMADIDVSLDEIIRRKKFSKNRPKPSPVRAVRTLKNGNYDPKRQFPSRVQGDARLKIISKQRSQMHDARDRLNMIAKKTDARQRLLKIKATRWVQQRPKGTTLPPLRTQMATTPPRSLSLGNLTRTIRPEEYTESVIVQEDPSRIVSNSGRITVLADRRNKTPSDAYYNSEAFPPVEKLISKPIKNAFTVHTNAVSNPPSIRSRLSENVSTIQGYRVVIGNLHDNVSQDDIVELFGEIGPLRHASLIRQGVAEVIFNEWAHALKACETYHNRQLDGKPMCVKLTSATTIQTNPSIEGIGMSRVENSKPRRKVSPDVDIIRQALFHKGVPSAMSSHQPLFSVTMTKK